MFQARGNFTMLSRVNWGSFWKKRWPTVSVFMG
jgi:hypothetical protein